MAWLLYPGCMVLTHFPEYEASARRVLTELGVELAELERFVCCSSVFVPSVSDEWLNMAAYTLALASEHEGLLTLCGTCTAVLRRAVRELENREARSRVNRVLAELGVEYTGAEVVHVLEFLEDRLQELELRGSKRRVAVQNPCNLYLPGLSRASRGALERVAHATGAELVEAGDECCGSAFMLVDEELALRAGRRRLEEAKGAEMLVACGNCAFLLQKQLGGEVVFFTELVEEALNG
ncbi:MAG: hypothetical protein GXN98_02730 [Euryarchaeota archaeon]|nr:hypothetical protein [Euryarchaeota archaeon]